MASSHSGVAGVSGVLGGSGEPVALWRAQPGKRERKREPALPCDDSPLERRTCPVALLLRGCGPTVGVSVEAVLVGLL